MQSKNIVKNSIVGLWLFFSKNFVPITLLIYSFTSLIYVLLELLYFLGIKQYGYWFIDNNNNKIEKSVFAGVPRDSINFEQIKDIYNGKTLTIDLKQRHTKSLSDMVIKNNLKPHVSIR